jgi:hypothetical protein
MERPQGLGKNIPIHARLTGRMIFTGPSSEMHASTRASVSLTGSPFVRFFERGVPDQVPVRVEDASSVWPC